MYEDFQMEQDTLVKYSGSDKDVVIPTGVKTVGPGAFAKKKAVKTVVVPEGVEVIERGAFQDCIHLKAVFLPDSLRLLAPGGFLVSDNVLQDGDVTESRFAVDRRNRTIHARMREYLHELKHHPLLETVVLPVGDGVTVSIKKEA